MEDVSVLGLQANARCTTGFLYRRGRCTRKILLLAKVGEVASFEDESGPERDELGGRDSRGEWLVPDLRAFTSWSGSGIRGPSEFIVSFSSHYACSLDFRPSRSFAIIASQSCFTIAVFEF